MLRLALRSGKIPSLAWIVAQVQRFDDRRVRPGLGLDLGHCGGDVVATGEWIKCGQLDPIRIKQLDDSIAY